MDPLTISLIAAIPQVAPLVISWIQELRYQSDKAAQAKETKKQSFIDYLREQQHQDLVNTLEAQDDTLERIEALVFSEFSDVKIALELLNATTKQLVHLSSKNQESLKRLEVICSSISSRVEASKQISVDDVMGAWKSIYAGETNLALAKIDELTELLSNKNSQSELPLKDFTATWINQINSSSLANLDQRYSPKQHIKTPSERGVDAFILCDEVKNSLIEAYGEVLFNWSEIDEYDVKIDDKDLLERFQALQSLFEDLFQAQWFYVDFPKLSPFSEQTGSILTAISELEWDLKGEDTRLKQKNKISEYSSGPLSWLILKLSKTEESLRGFHRSLCDSIHADSQCLLVSGEAGTGKSHLLGNLVSNIKNRGQSVLLLLGECFTATGEPWEQLRQIIGWQYSVQDFLASMQHTAELFGYPSVIIIDAVNESDNRNVWKRHLINFAKRLGNYPDVKLLISCRSDFKSITLPDGIIDRQSTWSELVHYGFGSEQLEAIQVYFKAFGVKSRYFPPCLEEFCNPLFLRIFCESFQNQQIPEGPITLELVMEARVDFLCKKLENEIDCDSEDVKEALHIVADAIQSSNSASVTAAPIRRQINQLSPEQSHSKSLYKRLVSSGIIVELMIGGEKHVRFPFERFSDYFTASKILSSISSAEELREAMGELSNLFDDRGYYSNRGLFKALCILVPERFNVEMIDLVDENRKEHGGHEDFLSSFIWRSPRSFSSRSRDLLKEIQEKSIDVIPTLLQVATIPHHPYNANFLSDRLNSLALKEREVVWTLTITNISVWEEPPIIQELISWSEKVPLHLVPDDQASLAAQLFLWLCTSNHRWLRREANHAVIRLLSGRPHITATLIDKFADVDDPYFLESLYASAAGVAMRESSGNVLKYLAKVVYQTIFADGYPPVNILIREYCQVILECSYQKGCLPSGVSLESFRPPFTSPWPDINSDTDLKKYEEDRDWYWITSSIRPNSIGDYGDWGRYVMEARVDNFTDVTLDESPPKNSDRRFFDSKVARNWVLQRIIDLGWEPELFKNAERNLNRGRLAHHEEETKVERISKKYQWIALHEFLGYLADHYWLDQSYRRKLKTFTGAWQIMSRSFDPSQPWGEPPESIFREFPELLETYPDPFESRELCSKREDWVLHPPSDFKSLLKFSEKSDAAGASDWIALGGHINFVEPKYFRILNSLEGALKMWVDFRSFLVDQEHFIEMIEKLSDQNFHGNGCWIPEVYSGWLGEYPWSEQFKGFRNRGSDLDDRVPTCDFPYFYTSTIIKEGGERLPSPYLIQLLDIHWTGYGSVFTNNKGEVVTNQNTILADSWGCPCLVKADYLESKLKQEKLRMVWIAYSERSCYSTERSEHIVTKNHFQNAVYWLEDGKVCGGFTLEQIHDFSENYRSLKNR